jgi:hypothetical protein
VTSIYFDTPALRLLRQKVDSDFAKDKIRVRWYEDPHTGEPSGAGFVERKQKLGSRRLKTRLPLPVDASRIAHGCDDHVYLRELLAPLRAAGHRLPGALRPFLRISFRRRRFVDPVGGARISLDTAIRASSVGSRRSPWAQPPPLAHAVLEVKGPDDTLPPWLLPVQQLGCRRESFSKYARCYLKLNRRSSF